MNNRKDLINQKDLKEIVNAGTPLVPVAVSTDGNEIECIELSDGSIFTKDRVAILANAGLIKGYRAVESKYGELYLRGEGDGDDSNNLNNLPRIDW